MADDRPIELRWRASSASGGSECVEVAIAGNVVHVRDSKDPGGATLRVEVADWGRFVQFVVGSATRLDSDEVLFRK